MSMGRTMIEGLRERGWMILNGSYGKNGEWTYIEKAVASIVDYVITNEKAIDEIRKVSEDNRTESDHIPLEVELEGEGGRKTEKEDIIESERSVWTEEGVEQYHGKCKG